MTLTVDTTNKQVLVTHSTGAVEVFRNRTEAYERYPALRPAPAVWTEPTSKLAKRLEREQAGLKV
jgi:hypothetical protein